MVDSTYEEGVRDGKIAALENMANDHKGRLDNHGRRLAMLERIIWGVFGIGVLVNFWPKIQAMIGG